MLLTVACPAGRPITHVEQSFKRFQSKLTVSGSQNYEKLHLKAMDQYLDFWNLMAYDFAGSWDSRAGHQSNLYQSASNPACTPFSAVKALSYYQSHGVPSSKLILGMPLYGRAFCNTDGPGSPYQGTGEGSWEPGVWDFKALPQSHGQQYTCTETCASWSYDRSKRIMVTYDTKDVAEKKARFIKDKGLGGAMWWESSADKKGDGSLIGTVSVPDFNVFEPNASRQVVEREANAELYICRLLIA